MRRTRLVGSTIKERKKRVRRSLIVFATLVVVGILIFLLFSNIKLPFVGYTVQENEIESPQKLNLEFLQSGNYELHLEDGKLSSIKLSGSITGIGTAKIYLGDLLIYSGEINEEALQIEKSSPSQEELLPSETPTNITLTKTFSDACEQTCDLTSLDLQQPSYTLNVELSGNLKLNLEEVKYTVFQDQENETVSETNITTTNVTETNASLPEANVTIPETNITLPENMTEQNVTIPEIPETNLTPTEPSNITPTETIPEINATIPENVTTPETNITTTNVTKTNITVANVTVTILTEENATIQTIQYQAVLNQRVKWRKQIVPEVQGNLTITLPGEAENITISKIENQNKEKFSSFSITGGAIGAPGFSIKELFEKFLAFLGLTGKAIDEGGDKKGIEIELEIDNLAAEYEIEYETPAPYSIETETTTGKQVTIVGLESVHYENVTSFTDLPKEASQTRIKLYRTTGGIREATPITNYIDSNNNGLIDRIEWLIPTLSNQTFEIIIEISKAEHLDKDKGFISDIYEQVKALDGNWSEEIANNEYISVTFRQNLTNSSDISLYPRVISGNPKIEVYEKDGNQLIAEFSSLISNQLNKVNLTSLQASQDSFDLKITGGAIQVDYIVDPSFNISDIREIGYEFLNDSGDVVSYADGMTVHVWNPIHDYYFNKTSGIQLTNNFQNYWTRNIFCGGYKNLSNDWIYECNDELPFTWNIKSDNLTYVNITGYRDITVQGRTARAAIRYHLKLADENLTIQLSIENIGALDIPLDLGFAWRSTDIRIGNDTINDKILVNNTEYWLNETLDLLFNNLPEGFYDFVDAVSQNDLWLRWNNSINYALRIRNQTGKYNAPVDFGINIGTLAVGQQKSTEMYWLDGPAAPNTFNATSPMDSPDPVLAGQTINFIATATATRAYDYVMTICSAAGYNCYVAGPTGNCTGGIKICESSLTANGAQATCSNSTITASQSGTVNYYAYTCNDNGNLYTDPENPNTYTVLVDNDYPIFSNYNDTNASLAGGGIGYFNVTVSKTNGTVLLEINGQNITARNNSGSATRFNATYNFTASGTYSYKWHSWGNGTGKKYNVSDTRSYTVNISYGTLNVTISRPLNNSNFTSFSTNFTINATVTCMGGVGAKCGFVNAYARYNLSSATPDTPINSTEGASPFYILEEWVNQSDGFSTSAAGSSSPYGITFDPTDNSFWVIDYAIDDFVYHLNSAGVNQSDGFSVSPGASAAGSIAFDPTDNSFWIIDSADDFVYHFNSAGVNQSDGFSTAPGATGADNIAFDPTDNSFWIIDSADDFVYHFNSAGINQSDGFPLNITIVSTPQGITFDPRDNSFWIVDNLDNFVHHLNSSGSNQTDGGFSLSTFGSTEPSGIALDLRDNNSFWITDTTDLFVYHISSEQIPLVKSISSGQSFNVFWTLNMTATSGSYLVDVFFNSSYGNTNVPNNDTENRLISAKSPYGTLNVTISYPIDNSNWAYGDTNLTITTNVACVGETIQTCGAISASARYNSSSANPDTLINITEEANPFYIIKEWTNQSDGFSATNLGSSVSVGITTNGSDFWITDSLDYFVYHVNRTGGNITKGFKTDSFGSLGLRGIATNDSDLWIVDFADIFVYHVNKSGYNYTDGLKTFDFGSGSPHSIATNGSDFWITDTSDYFVYHVNKSGYNYTNGFSILAIGSNSPLGITTNGSDFWIVDGTDDFVYHVNSTGGNMTDGFKPSVFGSEDPYGITTNGSDLWIADTTDDFIYHLTKISKNPKSSSTSLNVGRSFNFTWTLNVPSLAQSSYLIDVFFNSSYGSANVPNNDTENRQINIMSSYGTLSVNITYPINNSNWAYGDSNLTITANVTCVGGIAGCGTVYGWARYNSSSASPDTPINTTSGANPFYISGGSGGGASSKIYNFSGISYPSSTHNASSGSNDSMPSGKLSTNEIEFNQTTGSGSKNYTNIKSLDGLTAGATSGAGAYPFQKFSFKIDENKNSITQINISWWGHGLDGAVTPNYKSNIYVWNSTSWQWCTNYSDGTTNNGDKNLNCSFSDSTNITNMIDASNYLHIAVYGGPASFGPGTIDTDYIFAEVVTGGGNPQSQSLASGESFLVNWTLNVSSLARSSYLLDVFFNSSAGSTAIPNNDTENRQINIGNGYGTLSVNITYPRNNSNWAYGDTNLTITANVTCVGGIGGCGTVYGLARYNRSSASPDTEINNTIGGNPFYILDSNKKDYTNSSDGFKTDSIGAANLRGITTNGSDFWITDITDDFVYHTNRTGGNITNGFNTTSFGSDALYGITTNGSDFWITDTTDDFVYHVNKSGYNFTDGFSTSAIGASNPNGITTNGSDFWITDDGDDFVYHTDRLGNNKTDGFLVSVFGISDTYGTTTNGSDFWITDWTDKFVYHFNSTGGNMTDGFKIDVIGAGTPTGITTNVFLVGGTPTDFWITDYADTFVYHIALKAQNPQSQSLASGESFLVNWTLNVSSNLSGSYFIDVFFNSSYGNALVPNNDTSDMRVRLNPPADSTPPNLTITFPSNNTNTTNTGIDVNYTVDGTAVSCWYSNDSFSINTSLANCGTNITDVIWSDGIHNIRVYTNDSFGNVNSTSVRFSVDTTPPSIQIIFPSNNTNTSNTGLNINYTASDATTIVRSCWYSNDSFSINTSLSNCANITDITWSEGTHNVRVYANDSLGNQNSSSVRFTIDTIPPNITITFPLNNSRTTDTGLDVNYTVDDTAVSCWYSNDSYKINTSLANCGTNITDVTWAEGKHNVTIWVNDSAGNENKSSIYFSIDTTPPTVYLISPQNNTNSSSSTQAFSCNITNLEVSSLELYVWNSTGSRINILPYPFNVTNGLKTSTSGSANPYGTATNGSDFWVLDGRTGDDFVYHLNRTGGNITNGFKTTTFGSDNAYDITTNGTDFWITDPTDYFVYHVNKSGYNFTDGFRTFSLGLSAPNGITTNGSDFWITDYSDYGVYHVNRTGGNMTGGFSVGSIGSDALYGITTNGSDFWITDINDNFVYHVNSTGGNMTDGFKTNIFGIGGNYGITTNVSLTGGTPTDFWITDNNDDFVYHITMRNYISPLSGTSNSSSWNYTLPDGTYYWNCLGNDMLYTNWGAYGNRTLGIDTTKPWISITFPSNNTNTSNVNLNINYTVDDTAISCWYSNDSFSLNISLDNCGTNITTVTWNEGTHEVRIYTNDSLGNINSSAVRFTIDTIPPYFDFWKNMSNGFSTTLFGVTNIIGITTNGSDFWIIGQSDDYVYHTDSLGNNQPDGFSIAAIGSTDSWAITTNGSDFWITDWQDKFVYHTDKLGNNITNGFKTNTAGADFPYGITTNGSDFWVTDDADNFIYHFNSTGGNITNGFLTDSIGSFTPAGITTNGSDLWILDSDDYFVYHVNKSGYNFTDGTKMNTIGSAFPYGITTNASLTGGTPTDFWITDVTDAFVYHIAVSKLANQTLTAGQSLNYTVYAQDDTTGIAYFTINWTTKFSINTVTGELTNSSSLSAGLYEINVSVNDTAGNLNSSIISINVSAAPEIPSPTIQITYPSNNIGTWDSGIDVNYTVDGTAVSCWYSNDSMTINTSLADCGTNITDVTWASGQHNVTVWTNESSGIENSTSVTFGILSYGILDVNITSPVANSNFKHGNINLTINATVTCQGGLYARCGVVNALARYNISSASPDTEINTTPGAIPFSYNQSHGGNLSGSFTIDNPQGHTFPGIAFDPRDNSLWIVDSNVAGINHFNSTGGNMTDGFSISASGSANPRGVVLDSRDNTFWVVDNEDDFVYHVNSTGGNITDGFSVTSATPAANIGPYGLTLDSRNNTFWVIDYGTDSVYHFNSSGYNLTDGFKTSTLGSINPAGITLDSTDNSFWINDPVDSFVYHVNSTGGNLTDGFKTTPSSDGPIGTSFDSRDNSFWIIDGNDNSVYHFSGKNNLHSSLRYLKGGEQWNMTWVFNITSTSQASYLVDVFFNSSYGNALVPNNDTENRQINILETDIVFPDISITYPLENTETLDSGIDVNYTASDAYLSSCWYSNDSMTKNTTLTDCGTNITDVTWAIGQHNVTIWANDTTGNTASDTVAFTIVTYGTIDVNITSPINNFNFIINNSNLTINATVTCVGGAYARCGIVYALARYNVSSSPDTAINTTTGALPFSYNETYGRNLTGGFKISNFNANYSFGLFFDLRDNSFWIVDNADDFVYHVNSSGRNITGGFNTSSIAGANSPYGITLDPRDDSFWVTDSNDDFVYHFDSAGNNLTNGFKTNISGGAASIAGIAFDSRDSSFWVVDNEDDFVYHFDSAGNNLTNGFKTTTCGSDNAYGIIVDPRDNTFWISDPDSSIYHVNSTGGNITDGFKTSTVGSAVPYGLTFDSRDNNFWVLDGGNGDDYVYHVAGKDNLHTSLKFLKGGEIWNMTWSLKITSAEHVSYLLDVFFNSSYGNAFILNNDTEDRQIILNFDETLPSISIIFPVNNTNTSNSNLDVNYTASDAYLSSCWYSNDSMTINTSLTNCRTNITDVTWSDGQHNVTIWANDTAGYESSASVSFTVDTIKPNISITFPSNNTNTSNVNLNINYTVDGTAAYCWYSNDTFFANTNLANCENITDVTWSEGTHNVRIYANDSFGNVNSTAVRFTVDTIAPYFNFWKNATNGIPSSAAGASLIWGVTTNGSDFWIVDTVDNRVYHINSTGGNMTDAFNITLWGSSYSTGITTNGSDFWVLDDTDDSVYHVSSTGGNMSDGFSASAFGSTYPYGITTNGSDFWIVDGGAGDDFVYHVNRTGGNITNGFKTTTFGSDSAYGITTNGSDFWITDNTDNFVYHVNSTGGNMTDGFSASAMGSQSPYGITTNSSLMGGVPTDFWIADYSDGFVYHVYYTTLQNQTLTAGQSLNYTVYAQDDTTGIAYFTINWTTKFSINTITGELTNSSSLSGGLYEINISVNDTAGNLNSSIIMVNVSGGAADTTPPSIQIVYPSNNTETWDNGIDVNYTVDDTAAYCWYSNDSYSINTSLDNCGTNITDVTWSGGEHNVTIWTNDSAGNQNSSSVRFIVLNYGILDVDISSPINNSFFISNNSLYRANATLTINATVTCTGRVGARCGIVYALARYNTSSAVPDTEINTTPGAIPFSYNQSHGINLTGGFYTSDAGAGYIEGMAFDLRDNSFWMIDGNDYSVYHFDSNGNNLTDGFKVGPAGVGFPYGITFDPRDNSFWVTDIQDYSVYHFNSSGGNTTGSFPTGAAGSDSPLGITFDATDNSFWVTDNNDFFVYHFNSSGNNQSDGFSTAAVGSDSPWAIVFDPRDNSFWITDINDNFVYHVNSTGGNMTDGFSTRIGLVGSENPFGVVLDARDNSFWVMNGGGGTNYLYHFSGKDNLHTSLRSLKVGEQWNMTWTLNVTSLLTESYFIDVFFNSSYGNANVSDNDTEDRYIEINTLDLIPPSIQITYPSNSTEVFDGGIDVNYTASDDVALDSCWYSNTSGLVNYSLSSCANITIVTWDEGVNNIIVYANDTSGNVGSDTVIFTKVTYGVLDVNISLPINNSNFATTDSNLTVDASITCQGGSYARCGIVYATARYNVSSSSPDTAINTTTGAIPFSYNNSYGKNLSDQFNISASVASDAYGITFDPRDNSFWVVDATDDSAYHFNLSGYNFTDGFKVGPGAASATGITFDPRDNSFWVTDTGDDFVYHFNSEGINQSDGFSVGTAGSGNPIGITFDPRDSSFWVMDGGTGDDFVYHFNSEGINQSDGFSVGPGAASANGITFDPRDNSFWLTDQGDDFVYHFNSSGKNTTESFRIGLAGSGSATGITFDPRDNSFWVMDGGTGDDFVYHFAGKDNLHTSLRPLKVGEQWNMTWTLNVTSLLTESYFIDVFFNSSYGNTNVPNNDTQNIRIFLNPSEADSTPPNISIIFPSNNTNTSNTGIDVNYTASDANLAYCWYSNDTFAVNTTITCGTNITDLIWPEGVHNVRIYANDTVGNQNSSAVRFTVDTIPPLVQILYILNNTYTNNVGIDINYTVSDANPAYCWYSNDTFAINTSLDNCGTNITDVTWTAGTHNVRVYANDSTGNVNFSSLFFTVDLIVPNINFTFPTPGNATVQSGNSVYVNVSTNDTNDHSAFIDWNRTLVGWWNFESVNSTGGITDNSSYNRPAKLINATYNQTVSGIRGKGIEFDGMNYYVNLGSPLSSPDSWTYSLWFYPKSNGTSISGLIGQINNPAIRWGGPSRKVWLFLGWSESPGYKQIYSPDLALNQWYYIVGVVNLSDASNQSMSLYINGNRTIHTSWSTGTITKPATTHYLNIRDAARTFNGTIDEAMIFSRALSPEEINASYNAGLYKLYNNFSSLSAGDYSYKAWVIDAAGNINSTEQKLVTVDTTPPNINFTFPTPSNMTSTTNTSILVNVSTSDANEHSAFIDWNRSLVGWWAMDFYNATGIYDNSSYGNFGNFTGGLSINNITTGARGDALIFDGVDDYIATGSGGSLNVTGMSLTVSVWVNPREVKLENRYILGQGGVFFMDAMRSFDANPHFYLYNDTEGYPATSNAPLIAGQWNHLVGTYNGTTAVIYLNGVETGNYPVSGGLTSTTDEFEIGRISAEVIIFNGSIDEVMVWNRALSIAEITALYNATSKTGIYNNFSNLSAGNYTYKAWAIDANGNTNWTEQRIITIGQGADTTPPNINFTFPTPSNMTSTTNISILVNVSTSDASNHSAWIDWNRSLVGWWAIDYYNASGIYDNSTWNNFGTFNGGLGSGTGNFSTGARGDALKFDGINDYLEIPFSQSLNITAPAITMTGWVKLDELPSDQALPGVIGEKRNGSTATYSLFILDTNVAKFSINNLTNGIDGVSGATVLQTGQWYFLAGTYNGSDIHIYLNGKLDDAFSKKISGNITGSDSSSFYINYQGWLNGTIDEVMIFKRALSPEEINATYNAGLYKLYKNFSNLNAGNYSYKAWAIDANGNTNQTEQRIVTVQGAVNVAPNITAVYNYSSSVVLNSGPFATSIIINFTAYDPNGDLNESTARINVSLANEETRQNSTCSRYEGDSTLANFTCNITMWWFDGAGDWNITASIWDNASLSGKNDSITMYVAATTGFEISPGNLTWGSLGAGSTNQTSINDPLVFNNTGNRPIGDVNGNYNISINATDLIGEQNPVYKLFASNFSVSTSTGGTTCSGDGCLECGGGSAGNLSKGMFMNVTAAVLPKGNYTKEDGTAQEQLYFCLRIVGNEVTQQPYSTVGEGLWTIRIFLVAFIPAVRKKKKAKLRDDRLLDALSLIADELKKKYSLSKKELLLALIGELGNRYDVGEKEVLDILKLKEEITIPLSVFSKELGGLEAVVKYMKENLGMTYSEIAREIGRDERTIWTSYKKAKTKSKEMFKIDKEGMSIPSSIFKNKELTIFEAIISYLKEKEMRYSEIGKLLNRDQRNVRTIYLRAISQKKAGIGVPETKRIETKLRDDSLLNPLSIIADELKKKYSLSKKELLQTLIEELGEKYNLGKGEIENIVTEEITVPLSVFSKELGGLEAVVKYMKENLGMTYSEIAREIGRDERTVWTSYKKARTKQKEMFKEDKEGISIPISILNNKELTIFESVITYLREKQNKYSEIGKLLNRDQRNIWTIYSRTKKKVKKEKEEK